MLRSTMSQRKTELQEIMEVRTVGHRILCKGSKDWMLLDHDCNDSELERLPLRQAAEMERSRLSSSSTQSRSFPATTRHSLVECRRGKLQR